MTKLLGALMLLSALTFGVATGAAVSYRHQADTLRPMPQACLLDQDATVNDMVEVIVGLDEDVLTTLLQKLIPALYQRLGIDPNEDMEVPL